MPIQVVFYKDDKGKVPVLEWIGSQQSKVADKCVAKILRLAELGHELRRPEADLLRDGIYELRVVQMGQQYRIMYFFHGRKAVVLAHSFHKKSERVADREIELSLKRRMQFEADPSAHTYVQSIEE